MVNGHLKLFNFADILFSSHQNLLTLVQKVSVCFLPFLKSAKLAYSVSLLSQNLIPTRCVLVAGRSNGNENAINLGSMSYT
jgi:hypothetical protein